MNREYFSRTEQLIGTSSLSKLADSKIAVFGIGGVGGAVCEALARAGIGEIDIIDKDVISESNINRQLIAFPDTIGKSKVQVMKEHIIRINPDCRVNAIEMFFLPECSDQIDFSKYDYVIDAVDNVTAKLSIIENCTYKGVKVISCMGTGNKLDPTKFEIADIYRTSVCPLAKVIRHECKKRGIKKLKVLYSKEEPIKSDTRTPASISFVPPAAGYIIAGEVIRDLIKE